MTREPPERSAFAMSYCKSAAVVEAAPSTIWTACFEDMSWERWDSNILGLKDVSGACEDGTSFTLLQKDGRQFRFTLSNVVRNASLTFSGEAVGGTIRAEGRIIITPIDNFQTKIEYSFELSGIGGYFVAMFRKRDVVEGTESGIVNMARLSEEMQGSEIVTLN